jgi:hypothetical protein
MYYFYDVVLKRKFIKSTIPLHTDWKIGTEPGTRTIRAMIKIKSFLIILKIE